MKDQTGPRRHCSQAWFIRVPLLIAAPGKGSRSHRPGHHTDEGSTVALAPFLSAYRTNGRPGRGDPVPDAVADRPRVGAATPPGLVARLSVLLWSVARAHRLPEAECADVVQGT